MDEVKLAETLQDHKSRIGSLEHRMDNVEELTKSVNQLALTTQNLVSEVKHTNETVGELKEQMQEVNKRPEERIEQIKTAIISAITTAIIAAIVGAIITLL